MIELHAIKHIYNLNLKLILIKLRGKVQNAN